MQTTRRAFIAAIMISASAIVIGVQTRATEVGHSALTETDWTLSQIEGAEPLEGRGLDLSFAEDGQFGTSAGCNRFMGEAEIDGEAITFPDKIAGTMMACPEGLAEQEETVLALLARVTSYQIEPTALILLDEEGTELLRYSRDAEEESLLETSG
ncbi:META domain-containing protein [Tritonibacter scottomollicae]|uniref:Heat shock protein HslJ n=1 Tax=Tritonibacter scottomollicae TaxID=483013 RepID=A0A2T1AJQ8_TRISK|nr:META domain-containing protein [Tritonibacter scottomollicae]PRZ48824.1 heat shock protein HslJ [Tritonibacter scottomollicae]